MENQIEKKENMRWNLRLHSYFGAIFDRVATRQYPLVCHKYYFRIFQVTLCSSIRLPLGKWPPARAADPIVRSMCQPRSWRLGKFPILSPSFGAAQSIW